MSQSRKKLHVRTCSFFLRIYSPNNNASSSFSFSSNTLHASIIGCGELMSTPAAFSTSIGKFEQPAFKKLLMYFSTAGAPSSKIFFDSAVAAYCPVAYWYT